MQNSHGWPMMMQRKTAAAYCDLTEVAFEREVTAGRDLCQRCLGSNHWHREALDKEIARIAGITTDWRTESPLYAGKQE